MTTDKIKYLSERDYRLSKVIENIGEISLYKPTDPFSFLVYEIIGQMMSDKVRDVLSERFSKLCGNRITPECVVALDIHDISMCGLSLRKCNTIHDLAQAIIDKRINLFELASLSDEEVAKTLTQIKGIGRWTSNMFLLFYLQREDILPVEDAAFMQSFRWLYGYKNPSPETVRRRCAKWRPYSSLASRYMYRALDTGLVKKPVHELLCNN